METNERDSYRMARRPSKDAGRIIYPLIRCGTKPFQGAIILSHDIMGCYTHYWCRRTIPCRKENCPACEKGYSPRWHGWVFVQSQKTASKGIFEFTAGASANLDKYFREHRTLRGGIINAWREPARTNGRLVLEVIKGSREPDSLPKAIKLLPILMRMWNTRYEPSTNGDGQAAQHKEEEIRQQMADEKSEN